MAKKYYAVAVGRSSGIFTDWASAEREVKGFAGAKFKSFPSEKEAKAWLENPVYSRSEKKKATYSQKTNLSIPADAIIVYTDGGCIDNPGPGGYGVVIDNREIQQELSGGYRHTTNNRMEMMAAIVALRQLSEERRPIWLFSDSSYLVNGICKGWAKNWRRRGWTKSDGAPAINSDLWDELLHLVEASDVQFHWVKGHAGNPLNERCDRLAVAAAKKDANMIDDGYV